MLIFQQNAPVVHRAKDNIQNEVDHLAEVLKQNGYPANFIRKAHASPIQETADASSPDEEQEEKGPLVVIPLCSWDE